MTESVSAVFSDDEFTRLVPRVEDDVIRDAGVTIPEKDNSVLIEFENVLTSASRTVDAVCTTVTSDSDSDIPGGADDTWKESVFSVTECSLGRRLDPGELDARVVVSLGGIVKLMSLAASVETVSVAYVDWELAPSMSVVVRTFAVGVSPADMNSVVSATAKELSTMFCVRDVVWRLAGAGDVL